MRVLLVDDEVMIARNLKRFLTSKGHVVETAHDGHEGVSAFESAPEPFDVIVTDMRMPHMGGIDMIRAVRAKGYAGPVVMMGGHADLKASAAQEELQIARIIDKPFRLNMLLETLESAVGSGR